jgi:hypothetical protein
MSNEMLSPLVGSSLRIEDKTQLDDFLSRPDAVQVVKSASFEELFFTIKHVGLADSMELLPLVTGRQVRGFIDLDCWRKDTFVRKPFMEWIAAFIQSGPEETVRALSGVDEFVISLFLKDMVQVYEVDRDDPPESTQLIFTPDNRFGVEPVETGEATTIGMLILDALFKYNPHLGTRILTQVRYTTRVELEETAYENRTRRMEVHGFVDYYEALSIYAGPKKGDAPAAADRDRAVEDIPGEESPGNLPAMFADSLSGGAFLLKAFEHITDPVESDRFAQELTALGNRILSANLISFSEMESVRPSLEEMRDTLTIGLEHLTGGRPERAPEILRKTYIQTIFKIGFDQIARLRDQADALVGIRDFRLTMLDTEDQEFVEALRRFKPLIIENGRYRNFRTIADVEKARARLGALHAMAPAFLQILPTVTNTFARTFNTAAVRFALYGEFNATPLGADELQAFIRGGIPQPHMDVAPALQQFAEKWWNAFRAEMEPLTGKRVDPRFVGTVDVKL